MLTCPPDFHAGAALLDPAIAPPTAPALTVVDADGTHATHSRGELVAAARARAGWIAANVPVDGRVGVCLPNSVAIAEFVLGALYAGRTVAPLSWSLTAGELAFIARDAALDVLVTLPERASDAPDTRNVCPETATGTRLAAPGPAHAASPAYLVYTSGTSGRPKGVLHAHRAIDARRAVIDHWHGMRRDDVVLHAGKLNWTYTLGIAVFDALRTGAHAVVRTGPHDPTVWPGIVESLGVTLFAAVPTVYRQMLKYAPDDTARAFTGVRHVLTAGEALRPAMLAAWTEATGCPMFEALGMSEVSTYISAGPSTPTRPGSPGRPQPGRRVCILPVDGGDTPLPAGETGLLAVHRTDPGLFVAYLGRPDEDAAVQRGEWFVGGDLAHLDDDGYVWFHGRADDLMNAFGHRVSPAEVEAAIHGAAGVADVAVVERRVRDDVTAICAFIVPTDAATPPTVEVLEAHVATRIADYKRPRAWRFVEALPRTRSGKIRRAALPHPIDDGA